MMTPAVALIRSCEEHADNTERVCMLCLAAHLNNAYRAGQEDMKARILKAWDELDDFGRICRADIVGMEPRASNTALVERKP